MPYDQILVDRLRHVFADRRDVEEKKMFGGIAFMLAGHMCVGVSDDNLMARIGPDQYEEAKSRSGAREMDFTGRPMKGFVFVSPEGIQTERDLREWVGMCEVFVRSLPPK